MALVVCGVGFFFFTSEGNKFVDELSARMFGSNPFSHRDHIANAALAVWRLDPILGVGWGNFGLATSESVVQAALASRGMTYIEEQYFFTSHGHNLWVTLLVERGLVGVFLGTSLLVAYFVIFTRQLSSRSSDGDLNICMSLSAILIANSFTVTGLANTTMMNEHGHAGMAFIAVIYGYLRGAGRVRAGLKLWPVR